MGFPGEPEAMALAERVVASKARREPAWATSVGIPGYDALLRRASARAYEEDAREVEALLAEARALPSGLPRDALVTALSVEAFELTVARRWARDPDLVAPYFDHLLYVLLAPHLSRAQKCEAIAGRLEAAPKWFGEAWPRFDPAVVPEYWVEGALESSAGAVAFLDAIREFAKDAAQPVATRIAEGLAAVEGTLASHEAWLRALGGRAKGHPGLDADDFARLLRIRGFTRSPAELSRVGEALCERFRAQVAEIAITVLAEAGREPGDDPVAEALAVVRADHPPTFDEVLAAYRHSIEDARAFVAAEGLVEVPDVPLDVVETPAFLRHLIPFAAYIGPPRFAQPRRGTYLVTPKMDLGGFPRADIRNTTVHEAWPGHHLQLSVAALRAPLWSWLVDAIDHAEGWALYCEELMGERGFTASPKERFVRARDALWRAARIVIDVGLHTDKMTPVEGVERLIDETGMTQEEAEAEILRYTLEPGYNLSYMLGRLGIEDLRDRALAGGGSLRAFHDRLLEAGPLPVVLSAKALDVRQG